MNPDIPTPGADPLIALQNELIPPAAPTPKPGYTKLKVVRHPALVKLDVQFAIACLKNHGKTRSQELVIAENKLREAGLWIDEHLRLHPDEDEVGKGLGLDRMPDDHHPVAGQDEPGMDIDPAMESMGRTLETIGTLG